MRFHILKKDTNNYGIASNELISAKLTEVHRVGEFPLLPFIEVCSLQTLEEILLKTESKIIHTFEADVILKAKVIKPINKIINPHYFTKELNIKEMIPEEFI